MSSPDERSTFSSDNLSTAGKTVLEAGEDFEHIMALHLDPRDETDLAVVRAIESREGRVDVGGFVDRSKLHLVKQRSPLDFEIKDELEIKGIDRYVSELSEDDYEFIGLEDPDIWVDDGRTHLFYTIALLNRRTKDTRIYLGHAEGENLQSLEATEPVLGTENKGAKEAAIPRENSRGNRITLVESGDARNGTVYSVLRSAVADDIGEPWEFNELALHPADTEYVYDWCAGHVSTGPLLPESFADIGENLQLGFLNGREENTRSDGKDEFGQFSVGLMAYNYETGEIEWVSEEPYIDDPEAETITFASDFDRTNEGQGILYAHVDDSKVKAYEISTRELLSEVSDDRSPE